MIFSPPQHTYTHAKVALSLLSSTETHSFNGGLPQRHTYPCERDRLDKEGERKRERGWERASLIEQWKKADLSHRSSI